MNGPMNLMVKEVRVNAFQLMALVYYAYRALELTPENPETTMEIEPTSNIKGILDSTRSSIKHFLKSENWQGAIKSLGNIKLRSDVLDKSITNAYGKQLEIEEIEVIQTPISENKVKEFFNDAEKTWHEYASMRNLLKVYADIYHEQTLLHLKNCNH